MVRLVEHGSVASSYSLTAIRREMRKRLNPCSTVSVRPKPPSWASEHGKTVDQEYRLPARACETASDGGERFYGKLVAKCPRFKMVRIEDFRVVQRVGLILATPHSWFD